MEVETKQIVVQKMPTDLWRQLKIRAAADESTIQDTLAKAIQQFLKTA